MSRRLSPRVTANSENMRRPHMYRGISKKEDSPHSLGIHTLPLSTRRSVGVRSTPVASTHWCLTKPPSFVLAIITLTAATAPITLSASAHIWASVLKHALLKKQKLVSFVRLSGSLFFCFVHYRHTRCVQQTQK